METENQLDLTYWPSVDGWLRARLALEADGTRFVLFHMNEDYKTRAFVCSRDDVSMCYALVYGTRSTMLVHKRKYSQT